MMLPMQRALAGSARSSLLREISLSQISQTTRSRASNGLLHAQFNASKRSLTTFQSPQPLPRAIRRQIPKPTSRYQQLRFQSTGETVKQAGAQSKSRIVRWVYKGLASLGLFIFMSGGLVVAFFIYDATTYREEPDNIELSVSEMALHPRKGGPKNLPIAEYFVDDEEDEEMREAKHKPKLVILGTGWGSVALLKQLVPGNYHVTVVSPSNHFLFTPMLPSATVGTLEFRSLVEPIRKIIRRIKGHFLKASAVDVDFSNKLVELESYGPDGEKQRFYLPYDKLVIGVGSTTNPHGVKGLEHCHFLKDITDARKIRNSVIQNLEVACLPTTPDEERRRLLSFVVSGGGPTGVEFAAELYDMLNEDLIKFYPRLLRNEISVHVIQSRGHILNTYEEALSRYAEDRLAHDNVDVQTNSRVKEVKEDRILFTQKGEDGKVVTKELPMGFCLWSTGVSQTEFAQNIAKKFDNQNNRHALETDTHLRLAGAPLGDVYAIGDCSTVQNNVSDHIVTYLRTLAWEKGKDPTSMTISYSQWCEVAKRVRTRFPQAQDHLRRLGKLFEQYDKDKSGTLDFGELSELLKQIDSKLTSLPATAQRANQQGEYLGRKMNKLAQVEYGMKLNDIVEGDIDEAAYKAFEYRHMGSLAYIGNAAIFDFNGLGWGGGLLAVYLWRSIYFAQSVSLRTRMLLAMDWSKRALFGRGEFCVSHVSSVRLADFNCRYDELLDGTMRGMVKAKWNGIVL